jgi:hypothetical protein
MSEIDLTTDERKKMLHEEWFENNKEYEELLTEEESAYSGNLRSAHLPEKARNIEPLLNLEWNRVTAIDPAALDNGALINLKRYKIPDINIHEIQENHYRDFMENHKQVDEYVMDLPEKKKNRVKADKKERKVVSTVKKEKVVTKKPRKPTEHSIKFLETHRKEIPFISEPDLGCFPQLPLFDFERIKKFNYESDAFPEKSKSESPVKDAPEMGCFPQLPLLNLERIKKYNPDNRI